MEKLISANFIISLKVFHIVLESICGVKRYKLFLLAFNLHLEIIVEVVVIMFGAKPGNIKISVPKI